MKMEFHQEAIRIIQKALDKSEDGTMKIKKLIRKLMKKMISSHPNINESILQTWIQSSETKMDSLWQVTDKEIKLLSSKTTTKTTTEKKRNIDSSSSTMDASPSNPIEDGTKKSKKSKKSEATTTSSTWTLDDVVKWRKENKIVLKENHDDDNSNNGTPKVKLQSQPEFFPYKSFDAPGCIKYIPPELIHQCTKVYNFQSPSPIQAQCWPIVLEQAQHPENSSDTYRDVVGIAETGSGKTLAFAIPALALFTSQPRPTKTETNKKWKQTSSYPRMLVVAPTRELALQSHKVLQEFGAVLQLTSVVLYGGVSKQDQIAELKRTNVDMIVATPGRLKDLVKDGSSINLSQVTYLVLDEADRMLDDGFRDEIVYILSCCNHKQRRTLMFSATWPAVIQTLAREFLRNPILVYVGFESIQGNNDNPDGDDCILVEDSLSANKRVTQIVEVIEDRARDARLIQLLKQYPPQTNQRVLVFALYKKEAERLEISLKRSGWNCGSIHGNKSQPQRTEALSKFQDGTCPLLIATDVAARGLDIPHVELVVNYTFPLTIEDYVHRIGRTGRAGKSGRSHTFFQPTDKAHAGSLQVIMRQAGQTIPPELMKFGSTIKRKEHKLYGNFSGSSSATAGPMKKATRIVFD